MTDREREGALQDLAQLSRIDPERSHRPLLGGLANGIKRLARGGLLSLLGPWLDRQERFNQRVAALLESDAPATEAEATQALDSSAAERLAERLEIVHETLSREIVARETSLRRELREEIERGATSTIATLSTRPPASGAETDGDLTERASELLGDRLYHAFEDRYRGSEAEIGMRLASYLDDLRACAPVLDVGCGRGEFLSLLAEAGVEASGVDLSPEMVGVCREAGLDVTCADALEHLAARPEASLGGLFSSQFIEHLEPVGVRSFMAQAFRTLRPGGLLAVETVNVESLLALTRNYFADWTHRTPVGPSTLRFLAEQMGYVDVSIRFLSELPDHACLEHLPAQPGLDQATHALVDALNRNVERLNGLLYGPQDFALLARRP